MNNDKTIVYTGAINEGTPSLLRCIYVSKSLIDMGYNVVILAYSKNVSKKESFQRMEEPQNRLKIVYYHLPGSAYEWFSDMFSPCRVSFIKKCVNVKAVFAYNQIASQMMILRSYCSSHKIDFIPDVTEWYEVEGRGLLINVVKSIDVFLRMKVILPRTRKMICTSTFLMNTFKRENSVIALIPSESDIYESKWQQLDKYTKNPIPTFVYAGNPGKGFEKERLDWIIYAIDALNEEGIRCCARIVGIDSNHEAIKSIDPNKLKHMKFYGRVSHLDLLQIVAQSEFFVIPREQRLINQAGFPTKLAESFACGVPVVSTPTSDISMYITSPTWGYVSKDCSYESLFESMKMAALSFDSLSEKNHEHIKNNTPLYYKHFNKEIERLFQ